MKNSYLIILTLIISGLFCAQVIGQVYTHKYYNTPNGSYEYHSYTQGFTVPNNNFFYYNGSDMNEMIQKFNKMYSNIYSYKGNGLSQFNKIPNMNAQIPNNNFIPKTQDLVPAPSYKEAPNIYY